MRAAIDDTLLTFENIYRLQKLNCSAKLEGYSKVVLAVMSFHFVFLNW